VGEMLYSLNLMVWWVWSLSEALVMNNSGQYE